MCDVVHVDVSGKMFTLPSHRREALTGDDQAVTTMSSAVSNMLIPHNEILSCFTKVSLVSKIDRIGYEGGFRNIK